MDKKKIIAAIAAMSLTTGVAGFAVACGEDAPPQHKHTYSSEWTGGENTHWHESTCEHEGLKQPQSEAPHVDEDNNSRCDVCDWDMREVVKITIADAVGGKVTIDNTAPKAGDTVTATVTVDEGYTIKSVKLGDEVKTLDANNKFTFTVTEAVTITAEFEGKTIVLDASAVETAKGTVAFKFVEGKTEYKVGEDVVLKVTIDDYYKLSALYINGDTSVNYAESISNDGLVLIPECKTDSLKVTAQFSVGYRDITVNFKGKRLGEKNIPLDSDCGLTVSGYSDITLQNSSVTLTRAEVGKSYVVNIPNSGWSGTTFIVGDEETYNVELQWQPKLRFPEHNANIEDIYTANDGYITSINDMCDLGLYTEAFIGDNAMLTVNISATDVSPTNDWPRQWVGFMFERNDRWYATSMAVHTITSAADGKHRIEWNGNGDVWGCGSIVQDNWSIDGSYCNPFTGDMLAKYLGDEGIDVTVVRKDGNDFYVFVEGMFVGKKTVDAKYKGVLASPMIVMPRMTKGNRVDFSLTQDVATINAYLKSTVKVAANSELAAGVNVTVAKPSDAFKEDVTFTVTVPAGSVLTEFVVDGEDLIGKVIDGDAANTYKCTVAAWRGAGAHEFKVKASALAATATIDQTVKMGVADGTKIRFVRDGETTIEKTFEGGAVTFNAKVGAWKAQVFGFNTWLNVGAISVNGAEKTIDVNAIFSVGAGNASGYRYDMATGAITWNGKSRPDMRLNVDHTVGQDMWIVTKVKFPASALNTIKTTRTGVGMSYGLGFATSEKQVHVDVYSEGAEHSYIMVNTPWKDAEKLGYWHDFLTGSAGNLQNGKYANAMVGDGVYLIERYNAATGKTEYWVGEDLESIVLLFTYNSFNTLGTGALITSAGIYGGNNWSPGIDADFTCTLGIGSTLEAALGVAGKPVTVNVKGDKSEDNATTYCTVYVSEFTAGNAANIEITPTDDYSVKSVKINGKVVEFKWNEQEKKLLYTVDKYYLTTLDIEITVEEIAKANINAKITARQHAIISSINGKAFTLTDGLAGVYNGTVTADGRIQVSNVMLGTYTLKIAGYIDKQVEVTETGMANVTVEYDMFTDNSGQTNLTNQNSTTEKIKWKDGNITKNIEITTKDKFGDVWAKARFDCNFALTNGDMRSTILLDFSNGKKARIDLNITKNWSSGCLQSTEWDSFFGGWGTKYTFSAEELKTIKDNGYFDFALERKGADVAIYINGKKCFSYNLNTDKKAGDTFDYANAQAALNIQHCQDQERSNNHGFTLDVRESAPEADGE